MRGTNSKSEKNKKNRPKNHCFGTERRDEMEMRCRGLQKIYLGPLLNAHAQFQLPSLIWRGDRGGIVFFQGQKRREIPISPFLIILPDGFFDTLYNIWSSINWFENEGKFCFFGSSAPPPPNCDITKFWLKFIPTHIYLICRQIEPIDRFVTILICILQSKWFYGSWKKNNKYLARLKIVFLDFWDSKTDFGDILPPRPSLVDRL